MKTGLALALASLGLAGATLALAGSAVADDAATAAIEGKVTGGNITVKIQPAAGWYVNTEFDMKCTLASAGGAVGKAELRKADATFEASGKEGKAKSATLTTTATGTVSGECKIVTCSDNSCSAPFKLPITIK